MTKIRAAITGINAWTPEYRLTNQELSEMVETTDEWIMQRVGIKERRILKGEGKGTSDRHTPGGDRSPHLCDRHTGHGLPGNGQHHFRQGRD